MGERIELSFNKRPSALYTLWLGFLSRKGSGTAEAVEIPDIKTARRQMAISPEHLREYLRICDIAREETLPVLYPLMLIYPFNLRIVSLRAFPLGMFGMLNRRCQVTSYRPLSLEDLVDVHCEISGTRVVEKGLEVDVSSTVMTRDAPAWQCVNTFYFRGRFGEPEGDYRQPRLRAIDDAETVADWYLPAGNGFKFAKISGDSNGVHYSRRYAGFMGFKRDFAQPMSIAATCMARLKDRIGKPVAKVDLFYKGQVYYENQITLKHVKNEHAHRFDLYCEGNERPCICGEVA